MLRCVMLCYMFCYAMLFYIHTRAPMIYYLTGSGIFIGITLSTYKSIMIAPQQGDSLAQDIAIFWNWKIAWSYFMLFYCITFSSLSFLFALFHCFVDWWYCWLIFFRWKAKCFWALQNKQHETRGVSGSITACSLNWTLWLFSMFP